LKIFIRELTKKNLLAVEIDRIADIDEVGAFEKLNIS
jgi:hypothetical protein